MDWIDRAKKAVAKKDRLKKLIDQAEQERLDALYEGVRIEGSWGAAVDRLRERGEVE